MEVPTESVAALPGLDRLMELYRQGVSTHKMAQDPALEGTLLAGIEQESSRRWKCYHVLQALQLLGQLPEKGKSAPKPRMVSTTLRVTEGMASTTDEETLFAKHLADYERFIGAAKKRRTVASRPAGRFYEAAVFSDPHVPEERMDLIAQIALRHKGQDCYIVGDINDFEAQGKYLKTNWELPNLRDCLARTDAMFEFLTEHHPNVYILFGNHDLRLPRSASRALGPDFYWMSQEFLVWSYEQRHGVKVLRNHIQKQSGRELDLFFYHQLGDCILSHAECSGAGVGKGVEKAHKFYRSYQRHGIVEDFNVVLQAHTHKCSYYEHPETGAHLYEIGTVGDLADYALHDAKYSPPQFGYYHLVQQEGVTDVNASRLYRMK